MQAMKRFAAENKILEIQKYQGMQVMHKSQFTIKFWMVVPETNYTTSNNNC
jgi:hypothetical protein